MVFQIEIRRGNYTKVNGRELRQLRKKMYHRYKELGGSFVLKEFNSYTQSPAYWEMRKMMLVELERIFSRNRHSIKISHPNLQGLQLPQLSAAILPSTRVLIKIFNLVNQGIWEVNMRKISLDPCYLFAYGTTRPEEELWYPELGNRNSFSEAPLIDFMDQSLNLDGKLSDLLMVSVDKEILPYIALFSRERALCRCHYFNSESLHKSLLGVQPQTKSDSVGTMGIQTHHKITALNRHFPKLNQGDIRSAVLDLEQGRLFYTRLNSNAFLLGFCMNNQHLDAAEGKMREFGEKIREFLG